MRFPRVPSTSSVRPRGSGPGPAIAVLLALLLAPGLGPRADAEVVADDLEPLVRRLADPELGGRVRGTSGRRRAAGIIAEAFEEAGLEPAGDAGSFLQGIPETSAHPSGANVIGTVPGSGEGSILVCAHYDGVEPVDGEVVPGAEDNAAAVALLAGLGRELVETRTGDPPRRTVVLAAFDGGNATDPTFWGARAFLRRGPVPVDGIAAVIDLDMLGGHLIPGNPSPLFGLGAGAAPALAGLLRDAAEASDVALVQGGIHLVERLGPRSDYAPFRDREIPYAFVSGGPTPRYHTPEDTADEVNYEKLARVADLLTRLVTDLAGAESAPTWEGPGDPAVTEARGVRRLVDYVLGAREELDLSEATVEALERRRDQVETMIARGSLDEFDADYLRRTLETLLFITTTVERG